MVHPMFIFTALTGAAILGFILARTLQRRKTAACEQENSSLSEKVTEQENVISHLKTERETQDLALVNLQQLLKDIEQQLLSNEEELKTLTLEYGELKVNYDKLSAFPPEKTREIEVIREVPVLIYRDRPVQEDKREKAKKLVKAFRKGYQHRNESAPPEI